MTHDLALIVRFSVADIEVCQATLVLYLTIPTNRNPHSVGPLISNDHGCCLISWDSIRSAIEAEERLFISDFGYWHGNVPAGSTIRLMAPQELATMVAGARLWFPDQADEYETLFATCENHRFDPATIVIEDEHFPGCGPREIAFPVTPFSEPSSVGHAVPDSSTLNQRP